MTNSDDATVDRPGGPTRNSSQIKLAGFRQIFVWPLALDLAADQDPDDVPERVDAVAEDLRRHGDWAEVHDLLRYADPPGAAEPDPGVMAQSYAEFVYFYDFLQKMLFSDGTGLGDRARPIRLWRHKRLATIEFELSVPFGPTAWGPKTYTADVKRLNVYLFDSGAAIVALELDFGTGAIPVRDPLAEGETRPMTLADAQTICDHLRRVYTPFFKDGVPQRVPTRVVWRFADAEAATARTFAPAPLADDYGFVTRPRDGRADHRVAPVAEHWRSLLNPLVFSGYAEPASRTQWRHVLDERIPVMSFVSLTGAAANAGVAELTDGKAWARGQRADVDLVTPGDWVRLCSADEADDDVMPYNPEFLSTFRQTACYDRFFPDKDTTSAARYLLGGYHFAVVGAGGFFDNVVVNHFRRHYFQMVLLANLELASLLVTSSRISQAVAALKRGDRGSSRAAAHRRFMEDLEDINEWFLTFVHRYRFSGVSNQVQPSELYDRLRASMRLQGLFDEVKDELEAAVDFNGARQDRVIARAGERLANVATIAAAVGLAFAFLGMTPIIEPLRNVYKDVPAVRAPNDLLGDVVLTLLTVAVFSGVTAWMVRHFAAGAGSGAGRRVRRWLFRFFPRFPKGREPIETLMWWISGGSALLAVGVLAYVLR